MATNDKSGNQSGNQGGARGGKQGAGAGNQQSESSAPKKRGFASMDPEQQRQIAAEGGRAAHQKGTAHEFTSEEARRAGAMSHKNDANSQSGAGASRGEAGGGNKGAADEAAGGRGARGGSRS
nr:KGG domain-containing protein [uncultured Duganella sp.]